MPYVNQPTCRQPHRIGNCPRWIGIGVWVRLQSDLQGAVFAEQVLTLFIPVYDCAGLVLSDAEDANADPLLAIISHQPDLVPAVCRRGRQFICIQSQRVGDGSAILKTQQANGTSICWRLENDRDNRWLTCRNSSCCDVICREHGIDKRQQGGFRERYFCSCYRGRSMRSVVG